jgi:eukaryotic translation initiation factor 2C
VAGHLILTQRAGMNIQAKQCPVLVADPSIPDNIRGSLSAAFKRVVVEMGGRPQLFICVIDESLPMGDKEIYSQIKKVTLCDAGVVSQCMKYKNLRDIKDQYIANVALVHTLDIRKRTSRLEAVATLFQAWAIWMSQTQWLLGKESHV